MYKLQVNWCSRWRVAESCSIKSWGNLILVDGAINFGGLSKSRMLPVHASRGVHYVAGT